MRLILVDENTEGMEDGEYRIETGGVRFDEDWPGFFLRGDDALYVASLISSAFAMGEIDHLSLQMLKEYADEIFKEVPFKQWTDEDGHSIIQAVSGDPEEEAEDAVHVRRDGAITRTVDDDFDEKNEGHPGHPHEYGDS